MTYDQQTKQGVADPYPNHKNNLNLIKMHLHLAYIPMWDFYFYDRVIDLILQRSRFYQC